MRVIVPGDAAGRRRSANGRAARCAALEALGLVIGTIVVTFGLGLVLAGRGTMTQVEAGAGRILNLDRLSSAAELEPVLGGFESPFERQAAARALFEYASARPPTHVGALAAVTLPAAEVRRDARFVRLRARLAERPGDAAVAVLSAADLAQLKPRVQVRSAAGHRRRVLAAAALFVGAFWAAHLFRRWRGAADDPLLLPVLMLLSGLGLVGMLALRDPLRDTLTFVPFVQGVAAGVCLLVAVSAIDFETPRLREMVLVPLLVAVALAALLLLFGSGPGSSGVKVNLAGGQPVEIIRLLVVFSLAAYFARRLEFLRELSVPVPSRVRRLGLRVPRWRDVRPVAVSLALVLAFFFLQKDLGPALIVACLFLGLYGVARRGSGLVLLGAAGLALGFAAAWWAGMPATVRQRVLIWLDPWSNGLPGGNQIAHGMWALATGGPWGLGPGLGSPQSIPAAHTDFVLAVLGESLGFVGLLAIGVLYGVLCWRCLRAAVRAPGDYTAFLAIGMALALSLQGLVIAGGILGLMPLSGIVTPFLSYGRSAMLVNFAAVGVVLAVARQARTVRPHFADPVRTLAAVLTVAAAVAGIRAAWIQVARDERYAVGASLGTQADGGLRFEYNPRLLAAARQIPRGTIYDRHGLPIATSRPAEMAAGAGLWRSLPDAPEPCDPGAARCYPLGGAGFHLIGDWTRQTNWAARNSSYLERDRGARLQGFDDRPEVVQTRHPRTGAAARAVRRDLSDLLPLARSRPGHPNAGARALLARDRDVHASIDARLQAQVAAALRQRVLAGGGTRGAAVVLDADSGDVLASASFPWPTLQAESDAPDDEGAEGESEGDRLLDRARYGLYPPGSTFKLVVAAAALRHDLDDRYLCRRLPDGRVGNFIGGARRPVRDDVLDVHPHGEVDLHRGLVASCNAYFAQLAARVGPARLLDAAALFQIDAAAVPTVAGLRPTLPHAGYGQGEVLASPIRMARVAAAVAAGGAVRPPSWEPTSRRDPQAPGRLLSAADSRVLAASMREAVVSGTGRSLARHPVPIAGKTGTAEVNGGRSHAWFVGFAPYGEARARRIAFAVIVENAGYGGRLAAPVAGDIVSAARTLGIIR